MANNRWKKIVGINMTQCALVGHSFRKTGVNLNVILRYFLFKTHIPLDFYCPFDIRHFLFWALTIPAAMLFLFPTSSHEILFSATHCFFFFSPHQEQKIYLWSDVFFGLFFSKERSKGWCSWTSVHIGVADLTSNQPQTLPHTNTHTHIQTNRSKVDFTNLVNGFWALWRVFLVWLGESVFGLVCTRYTVVAYRATCAPYFISCYRRKDSPSRNAARLVTWESSRLFCPGYVIPTRETRNKRI